MNTVPETKLHVPVYGAFTVYPNGTREESEGRQFDGPCEVPAGPDDWFGFSFWALADVEDDDVKALADAVAHVPRMRDLNIGGCGRITDRGLAQVARFGSLEDLCMNSVRQVSGRGLAEMLGRLSGLVKLNLEYVNNVSDATLEVIARLPRLEELNANQCPDVTDAGLAHLTKLSGLTHLGVSGSRISDRGVEHIAALRRLKSVGLPTDCRITDRSLERLGELPDLAYITLPNCAGFLRRLLVGGISRKGLERFRQAKPDCDIWSHEIYNEMQRLIASA